MQTLFIIGLHYLATLPGPSWEDCYRFGYHPVYYRLGLHCDEQPYNPAREMCRWSHERADYEYTYRRVTNTNDWLIYSNRHMAWYYLREMTDTSNSQVRRNDCAVELYLHLGPIHYYLGIMPHPMGPEWDEGGQSQ